MVMLAIREPQSLIDLLPPSHIDVREYLPPHLQNKVAQAEDDEMQQIITQHLNDLDAEFEEFERSREDKPQPQQPVESQGIPEPLI